MNFSLLSSSILLVLLVLNALLIFGVPAGDRGNQSTTHLNESSEAVFSNELDHAVSHQSLMADASTTDFSKVGRNVGNDVELFGEGPIPVILRGPSLQFRACCSGASHVCYKSGDVGAAGEFCPGLTSYCGFEMIKSFGGGKTQLLVNGASVKGGCQSFAMRYSNVTFGDGYSFPSCEPIMEHQMVMLESYAQPSCPITIPNAYIPDPPTTVSPALSNEASDSAAAVQSANFFETSLGIFAIIGIVLFVLLVVGVFVGVILCLLCKKPKIFKSKTKEVNVESIQIDQPVVEEVKKSKTEVPKKQQPKMKIEKLSVKENVVEKKKKDAEAPKKLEGKAIKEVVKPPKKAAEKPRKNSDEPKMKSDSTQEPTVDGGPQPVIDEDAPLSPPLPPPAVVDQKAPAKLKNAAPPPVSNNKLAPPPSKHHRHRHVKRAPPTFEAPTTPSTSVSEAPPPPVATAVQPPPQKKKKLSPTLDSQDRERRRMIRSGQAVKPRPGENIRKYLPKNY